MTLLVAIPYVDDHQKTMLSVELEDIICFSSLDAAEIALLETSDSRLLLMYSAFETVLSSALTEKRSHIEALTKWLEHAASVVSLIRRHRDRVFVVEAGIALNDPDGLAAYVGLPELKKIQAVRLNPNNDLFRLVADFVLQREPFASSLAGELEASSVIPSQTEDNLVASVLEWHEGMEVKLGEAVRREIALQRNLELRHLEISELRGGYDAVRAEVQLKDEQITVLNDRERNLSKQILDARAEKGGEIELLNARMSELVQNVASLEAQLAQTRAAYERADAELRVANINLAGIKASRSYRVMEPARRLRGWMLRRRKING
ncbi:hypothetical protein [Roseivivax isoporae]|uniref:hypothetical protein n=1 Tax=Roseivivax isoporae TaxID=591206 RepID=UPI0012EBBAE6|nr:hypothetical protein [Roseivivax isoporae]